MTEDPQAGPDAPLLKPVRPLSVVSDVTVQLSQLIRDGHLKPGDQLPPETELAEQLAVGRSTVREAKRALVAMGLIHSEGKRGTFVSPRPTGDDELVELRERLSAGVAMDIYEARKIIEVGATALAASRRDDRDLHRLDGLLHQLEREWNNSGTWSAGLGFHVAIVSACHNEVLIGMYAVLAKFVDLYHGPYYRAIADPQEEIDGHRILLEAIRSGEPDRAAQEMRAHLDEVEVRRQRAVDESTDPS